MSAKLLFACVAMTVIPAWATVPSPCCGHKTGYELLKGYDGGVPRTWEVVDPGISNTTGRISGVKPIWIEGEQWQGKQTRIFAWWGLPKGASADKKVPAMVLVHGGGGTAFASWVKLWNDRGYAAIAMDTCGGAPRGEKCKGGDPHPRHPWSGPVGWHDARGYPDGPLADQWPYQAVTAVIRSHSFIRSLPEVDAERTGITGISWGGYLTSIVMGIDHRFKFAAPVYGCGWYDLNRPIWAGNVAGGGEKFQKWLENWDAKHFIGDTRCPVLRCNGDLDIFYTVEMTRRSTEALPKNIPSHLSIKHKMPHGHPPPGDPKEIRAWADYYLKGAAKPMSVVETKFADGCLSARLDLGNDEAADAELFYAKDVYSTPTRKRFSDLREWTIMPIDGFAQGASSLSVEVPPEARLFFANVKTASGMVVTTSIYERESPSGFPSKHLFDETAEQKAERMSWWVNSRFGMFIHFGLYAIPARGEWVKKIETIPEEKYEEYFKTFNPDLFDAKAWAKAAKSAGMKYAVLTTKHHEGFCLWDSKFTDYKITKTPFGRDLVREFVEAFRAEGLRVGFYYSLIDWHHPDFTIDSKHPRRPKWANDCGTFGDGEKDYPELNRNRDMSKYRQYMKDQLRELLTGYGKIDILWADFSYPGEHGKGPADWDSEGLVRLARTLQPQIIVNNRMDLTDTADGWDFVTPEQFKVKEWPTVGGRRGPWETCQTFSGSWGYARDENTWKSPESLIALLVETVSKGGNLIMNVGPTARGQFDARAESRLSDYARWMESNEASIYGCTEAPQEFVAPENTVLTYNPRGRQLFVHLVTYPGSRLDCPFAGRVAYARFLHDGSEIQIEHHVSHQPFFKSGCEGVSYFKLPVEKPDVINPVIEVVLK